MQISCCLHHSLTPRHFPFGVKGLNQDRWEVSHSSVSVPACPLACPQVSTPGTGLTGCGQAAGLTAGLVLLSPHSAQLPTRHAEALAGDRDCRRANCVLHAAICEGGLSVAWAFS